MITTLQVLRTEGDYTISPSKDLDPINGVSTQDIVIISKHILGLEALNSPYKLIAADVNNSRSITTLDLIQLRKLILSIDVKFSNNTSWRFIDANYAFPNRANPWLEQFPEIININNMDENMLNGDFVAVKVGDVNGTANPGDEATTRNLSGVFNIDVENANLVTGNEYKVPFTAADLANVEGYQFTLNLGNGLDLVDVEYGVATEENFGFINDRTITTSWNGAATSEVLFTIVVRANADVELSQALSVSSRFTTAEAYNKAGDLLDVALNFGGTEAQSADFALYQNNPNPFKGETVISFNLPEASEASITISDITGRTLKIIRGDFAKGYNEVRLSTNDLPTAVGVLSYKLTSADLTATKQMIITE